jgi:hypothetical protein
MYVAAVRVVFKGCLVRPSDSAFVSSYQLLASWKWRWQGFAYAAALPFIDSAAGAIITSLPHSESKVLVNLVKHVIFGECPTWNSLGMSHIS